MATTSKEHRYASAVQEDDGSSPATHISAYDGVVSGHEEKQDVFGPEEQHQVGEDE